MLLFRHAVIPLVVLVLLSCVAFIRVRYITKREGVLPLTDILWVLPFAVVLIFFVWGCAAHRFFSTAVELAIASFVVGSAGSIVALRSALFELMDKSERLSKAPSIFAVIKNIALTVVASVMAIFALESAWNPNTLPTRVDGLLFEFAIVFCIALALVLLASYRGVLAALLVMALCAVGIIQAFVIEFRGLTISPSDVSGFGTALSVASGYTFNYTGAAFTAISCAAIGVCATAFIHPPIHERQNRFILPAVRIIGGVAILGTLWALFSNVSIYKTFAFTEGWWAGLRNQAYAEQGFISTFAQQSQVGKPVRPNGFSDAGAEEITKSYLEQGKKLLANNSSYAEAAKQFSAEKPHIIVVMNESFADLSRYESVDSAYEGPSFFKNEFCVEALLHGPLYVSPYGGQTCNAEFELMTGAPLMVSGVGLPYRYLTLTDVHSLGRELADLGYHPTLVHPNFKDAWFRSKVYPELGVDNMVDRSAFGEEAEIFHSGVSDAETYQAVLDSISNSDEPQFIYDITISNHGGYDQGIDESLLAGYSSGISSELDAELNEYLGCIERSDQDLKAFVDALKDLDDHVIVLFFGDHQPGFTIPLAEAQTRSGNPIADGELTQETVYAIWANYELDSAEHKEAPTSINFLSSILLREAGAPLDDQDLALLAFQERVQAINQYGYLDSNGVWHASRNDDGTMVDELNDLAWYYYLNFGEKV